MKQESCTGTEIFAEFANNRCPQPEEMERFNNRVDYYLRGAAEELAKDFGLERKDWPLLEKGFLARNGGFNKQRMAYFYYYAHVHYKEDTLFLTMMLQHYPSIFLERAVTSYENTFRFTFNLWLDAMDTSRNSHQDPWSLRLFWNHFQPVINYFLN